MPAEILYPAACNPFYNIKCFQIERTHIEIKKKKRTKNNNLPKTTTGRQNMMSEKILRRAGKVK